jgi:hypothetical protein
VLLRSILISEADCWGTKPGIIHEPFVKFDIHYSGCLGISIMMLTVQYVAPAAGVNRPSEADSKAE